jgi:acyl-coenzyme A thioesterase PaaI-like protein
MLGAPQPKALGLRLVAIARRTACFEAPFRDDLVGDPERGIIAGGVVTTLIDHALATAVRTVKKGGAPTLDLRVDYVRAAAPRAGIFCEATCYKLTRSIGFTRAVVWDTDRDDPIATAQATFAIPERKRP